MFSKLLVANRGEIAVRVLGTAKRLGLGTVAVYSEADAGALHVAMADEAYCIGPARAADSYLVAEAILEAARKSGADAVHPGYGFLAENADFAAACAAAGVAFVGPPPDAIRAMGSKSAAKAIMEKAGVPLVAGYHGDKQDLATLRRAARDIGFPVLVKASAGGGGLGLRIVDEPAALKGAVKSARRQAKAAFGDDRLLIETYMTRPRHVEVQVFADDHGHVVHLFERDCSIQRRHQKVVEEAPAPGMTGALRRRLGEAAVAAARAIDYRGAGTVEFLLDDDDFYFMEMNTRLQVEHPVTEMITGQDLVEWQLRVAAGEPLPCRQEDLAINGHAIEVRVYAEDPGRNFLPSSGRLRHLRVPAEGPHVRVDSGVREGDEVTPHYDPLIAKLIVWDSSRDAALGRLATGLAAYQVVGPATNIAFLAAIAAHPAFAAGDVDTGFIERHRGALIAAPRQAPDAVLAIACLDSLLRRARQAAAEAHLSADPHSPWRLGNAWRLNAEGRHVLTFMDGSREVTVTARVRGQGFLLDLPSGSVRARGEIDATGDLVVDLDGVRSTATVVRHDGEVIVMVGGASHGLTLIDAAHRTAGEEPVAGCCRAPMPGKIIAVMAKAGRRVRRGAPLMVLEAMKMEHTITAPADGTVAAVHYGVGDQVEEGAELLAFVAGE